MFAAFDHNKGQNLWIYFVKVVIFWPQSLGQPRIDFPKQVKQNHLLMKNLQRQIDGIKRSKNFQCSKCPRSFKRETYLQNHIILAHQGSKTFKCIDCKTVFESQLEQSCKREDKQESYSKKAKSRSHLKKKLFKCNYCDVTITKKSDLGTHLAIVHQKSKTSTCLNSEENFSHKDSLENNFDKVHSKETNDHVYDEQETKIEAIDFYTNLEKKSPTMKDYAQMYLG